ncbi:hypothetical protein D9M68_975560 [compost metagenome]
MEFPGSHPAYGLEPVVGWMSLFTSTNGIRASRERWTGEAWSTLRKARSRRLEFPGSHPTTGRLGELMKKGRIAALSFDPPPYACDCR